MRTEIEYVPDEDEEYMNPRQLVYFRMILLAMRAEIAPENEKFLTTLKEKRMEDADLLDQCSTMQHIALDLSSRALRCRTIEYIDGALERMQKGEYGYCDITGEEIGVKRLMAMPFASLCVEAQECQEQLQTSFCRMEKPAPFCSA